MRVLVVSWEFPPVIVGGLNWGLVGAFSFNLVGAILGGAVVVETVFSWPGLGRLAFEAVLKRDFSVLLGILLLSSLMVIIVNMLVDLLHTWLDPRIAVR